MEGKPAFPLLPSQKKACLVWRRRGRGEGKWSRSPKKPFEGNIQKLGVDRKGIESLTLLAESG